MNVRPPVLFVALAAIAVLGLVYLTHEQPAAVPVHLAAADTHAGVPSADPLPSPAATRAPVAGVTAADVDRWTADASSGDATRRAAALNGLARAPVQQALPVLRRALLNGEPVVDRKLALQSLRDLALEHGDPNSAIRNAIREAIYHGDDQSMSGDAQEAIDVIEESLLQAG